MGTGGYLEIYTTLFGWQFYGLVWRLFSDTGLLFIPFLGILISNWKSPAESQDDKPASSTSLRRNMIELPLALGVFMLAVVPILNLSPEMINYKDKCEQIDVTGSRTGTTYDETLGNWVKGSGDIRTPIYWALVMRIGAGMSSYLRGESQCMNNLRDWDSLLRTSSIQDRQLRGEYNRFYSECYLPAIKKFNDPAWDDWKQEQVDRHINWLKKNKPKIKDPNSLALNTPDEALAKRAFTEDMNYIAPRFFLETEGFFKSCSDLSKCGHGLRAASPVDGWPYDPDRDADYSPYELDQVSQGQRSGRPTCAEWWEGMDGNDQAQALTRRGSGEFNRRSKKLSLKRQLVDGATSTDGVKIATWFDDNVRRKFTFGSDEFKDKQNWDFDRTIIKRLMRNGPPEWTGGDYGVESTSDKALMAGIVALGGKAAFQEAGSFYIGLMFLREVAPMVKAMILMGIYMLLLVYLTITRYSFEGLMPMTMFIISIMCWSGLWEFAKIIDENLFLAMYPDPNVWGGGSEMGPKRLILDLLTSALFIILPLILSWLMTMAGLQGGKAMDQIVASGSAGSKSLGSSGGSGAANSVNKMTQKK